MNRCIPGVGVVAWLTFVVSGFIGCLALFEWVNANTEVQVYGGSGK